MCVSFLFVDSTIENHKQREHDRNRGRLFHLQKLVNIGKLNCCTHIKDNVPAKPRQIADRLEHKPFNGVCVLPNMPDVDALIQEFEASYANKSPANKKKSATNVAKAEGMFVKKIIEIYETKKGKVEPWPLDGQQAAAEATVGDKREAKEKRSSLHETVQMLKKTGKTRDGAEKRELADAMDTVSSDLHKVNVKVKREDEGTVGDIARNNGPEIDDVGETSELTVDVPSLHANSLSSSKRKKSKTREKDKSSRKLRRLLCKCNRSGLRRVTRRCRLASPRRDEFWHTRRKGRVFSESSLRDVISKCDEVAPASSLCATGCNLHNVDDHNTSTVESQDDNSYKNLQIDMFDFEDKEGRSEARDFEDINDSLSLKSVDRFLPSLDRRNNPDGIADMTCIASSSFEDNASDRVNDENTVMATDLTAVVDESIMDACLEQSTEIENEYSCRDSKLRQGLLGKTSLKKILSLFSAKRYFGKKTKNAIGKTKSSWWSQRKSQRTLLSPDSGFGEQSVSGISPLPITCFSSEKSACSGYHESPLTFKTFRPRDSLPRDDACKWKRRLVLNELPREKLANAQDEQSSCSIPDARTETSSCDRFSASSSPSLKDSASAMNSPRFSSSQLLLPLYLSQKIPRSTFPSLTRVDEISEELDEQLDESELRCECSESLSLPGGWASSSPYLVCKEPR